MRRLILARGQSLQEDESKNVSQNWREEFGRYLDDCLLEFT